MKKFLIFFLIFGETLFSQTGLPKIQGGFSLGSILTVDISEIEDNNDVETFKYQWIIDNVSKQGSTYSTYKLSQYDLSPLLVIRGSFI